MKNEVEYENNWGVWVGQDNGRDLYLADDGGSCFGDNARENAALFTQAEAEAEAKKINDAAEKAGNYGASSAAIEMPYWQKEDEDDLEAHRAAESAWIADYCDIDSLLGA